MRRVAVFGVGYVGSVTAACLSRDGHHVIGVDVDEAKVARINDGVAPVVEQGLNELVRTQVSAGRLSATDDVEHAVRSTEIALIAAATPASDDGSVSSQAVEKVVEAIGQVLADTKERYTIVIRSTLLPGILEERLAPLLKQATGCKLGPRIALCNNPEFLRETTAISDFYAPPFLLVGAAEPHAAQDVLSLYERVDAERHVTDTRTAALVKYACNAFHALKIAFANELGTLARAFSQDGQEVMRLVCRDHHLNISPAYLRPGFAFGGSCLPKDVRALSRFAQQHAIRTELLNSILHSNEAHIERALRLICEAGCRKVGLVGLTFKAGTDDLRESPQVVVAETLLGRGYDLKIYDPGVRLNRLTGGNRAYVEVRLPHLAALLTDERTELFEHAELLVVGSDVANDLQWESTYCGKVIDLRRDLVAPRAPTTASCL